MEQKSVYTILDIVQTATDDEIKNAYRKLAVTYHPDKNPGDTAASQRFCEITEAYNKVRDPVKRTAYDRSLKTSASDPASGAFTFPGTAKNNFDIADALREFMMHFRTDRALRESFEAPGDDVLHGGNIRLSVALSLRESAIGVQKNVEVNHLSPCQKCSGSGRKNNRSALVKCSKCGGLGILRIAGISEIITCTQCYGTKQEVQNGCPACTGSGRVPSAKTIPVTFPPGIGEGNFITLNGHGNSGIRNGKAGDLVISIEEIPDAQFRRLGYDLETEANISLLTAVLGGKCMLLTLDGETVSLQIPPGTQPETLFCLKELGLPRYHGTDRGSLYAKIHVKIPEKLTPQEKELFESLALIKKGDVDQPHNTAENKNWLIRKQDDLLLINAGTSKFDYHIFELPEVAKVLTSRDKRIGLDLCRLSDITSMDVGHWIKVGKSIQQNGGNLFLVAPQKAVREVIKDTRIDATFPIIDKL